MVARSREEASPRRPFGAAPVSCHPHVSSGTPISRRGRGAMILLDGLSERRASFQVLHFLGIAAVLLSAGAVMTGTPMTRALGRARAPAAAAMRGRINREPEAAATAARAAAAAARAAAAAAASARDQQQQRRHDLHTEHLAALLRWAPGTQNNLPCKAGVRYATPPACPGAPAMPRGDPARRGLHDGRR